MGYFSNGAEGADWRVNNCERCANSHPVNGSDGCPIWDLHLLHNYDQMPEHAKTDQAKGEAMAWSAALGMLIKRDGLSNECTLFRVVPPTEGDETK